MTRSTLRLVPLLVGALVLTACADHKAKPQPTTTHTVVASSGTTATTHTSTAGTTTTRTGTRTAATSTTKSAPLPDSTGIAACDEYLASYKSCHLVAGVFARDQIDSRYDMMRTSLLRQSQDPDMRDQLGARCSSLAGQLKDVLKGRSCADTPAPASTR
jgi:hypothetical protein